MYPEVTCGQNHTIAVDYFTLGVYSFESIFERTYKKNYFYNFLIIIYYQRPYLRENNKEINENIMNKQVYIRPNDIPNWLDFGSCRFYKL